jgi:gluconate 2-dehydrogenase gamma chain
MTVAKVNFYQEPGNTQATETEALVDTKPSNRTSVSRRELLTGTALIFMGASVGHADILMGQLPWAPDAGDPPLAMQPGRWLFFTAAEARAMEAIADRIIPPDPDTPGGKDSGCAVFIDRQLAGPYGRQEGLYTKPPFRSGAENQGEQSQAGPAQTYRQALAALERACQARSGGKSFESLAVADQDRVLMDLESGALSLEGVDGKSFFERAVKDMQMGFFADPIYGGNRGMVAWKMIGFPGARYNYLDWVNRHNERFPLPPVAMSGRAEWTPRSG